MKTINKTHFLLIFTILTTFLRLNAINSEEIIFEKIDNRDGLSSDLINHICQDNNGFIWIATQDGLNCYTGSEFIVYKHRKNDPNSLSSSHIRKICPTPDGNLWMSTLEDGINILNPFTKEIQHLNTESNPIKIQDNHVNYLICDSQDRLWMNYMEGISMYDFRSKTMTHFIDPLHKNTSILYEDSNGNILAGSWQKSMYIYDEEIKDFVVLPVRYGSLKNISIISLLEDKQGYLWIGTWGNGLYKTRLYDKQLTILDHKLLDNNNFPSSNIYNIVYDIDQDVYNNVWLGTDAGLGRIKINNSEGSKINIEWMPTGNSNKQFKSKDARNLFVDDANTIWIGTQGNGISKIDYNQANFKSYRTESKNKIYSSDIFRSFWKYNDELYVGINAMGFGKYDLTTKEITPYNLLPEFHNLHQTTKDINAVIGCYPYGQDTLLIHTRYKGLFVYDLVHQKTHKIQLPVQIKEDASFLIEKDQIWITSLNGLIVCTRDNSLSGIFPFQKTLYKHDPEKNDGLHKNSISDILRDKSGQLWISYTHGGLDRIIENPTDPTDIYFKRATLQQEDFWPDINTLFEDTKGNIWLGTKDYGLALLDKKNKRISNFSNTTPLEGKTVFSLQEDKNNNLWLSTNNGLYSFNFLNMSRPYFTNYSTKDGLQGNIFIKGASFKDEQGNLYFGGYHGFNYFNPERIHHNEYIPPLVFTHFEIDHAPRYVNYTKGEVLEITHKNSSFQISFDVLSYTQSSDNQTQFKLMGYDEKWINTDRGNNSAIYGKLPPGNYTFLMRGANNNGLWNDKPISLQVVVKKSPYHTILAYGIYILLLLSAIWAYIYYTQRNFKLTQAYKEEQNERKRSEKINQFKLKFFTNISHELLTPLSIISNAIDLYTEEHPSQDKNLAIITRNTNRLTRLISQLLDFRKVEGGSRKLMVEETNFNHLVSSLKDNFLPLCEKKNIKFTTKSNLNANIYIDLDKVDKMLHNILSNAYKNTPENGHIRLEYETYFKDNNEMLCFKIMDSGPGIPEERIKDIFERFYRINDHKQEAGAGIGLAFTKALVELHKGSIKAENNTDGGATFTIEIPVSEWAYSDDEKSQSTETKEPEYSFADEMDDIKTNVRLQRENDEDLPKILIVEDNTDMRTIMSNYLSKYFDVSESENGIEGLEVLKTKDIELIISDIMMPKMDGLSFCKRVKSSIMTSHIPVILTTAKRTEKDYIEGYEAQADSYITKPVNLQLLLVRIINLLKQRQELRKVFAGEEQKDIKEYNINNLDQDLLEKLNQFIEKNIDNSSLTIGMLSQHVGVSSSVFYRKLKSYTGMSPNEYLKTKRLNKAAELLKGGMSASSVAYECGFSDPSYFGVSFKKYFGMPPKKYVESL